MVSLFYLEFLQLQSSSNHRSQIFIVLFDICVAFHIYFTTTLALWLLIHTPKNSLIHKGLLFLLRALEAFFLVSANALPLMAMSVVISQWKRLSVCTCIIWGILAAGNLTRGRWTCSRLQKYHWNTFGNTCRHSAQILQTMCDYGNLTQGRWTCNRLQK